MHVVVKRLPEKIVLYDKDSTRISAVGWSNRDIMVTMDSSDGSDIVFEEVPLGSFYNHAPHFIRDMSKVLLDELWEQRPQDADLPCASETEEPCTA